MTPKHKTIAIVINTSWNIYNFRQGLLCALQNDGYRIVAIAPRDGYSQQLEALGFEYHNISINNQGTNPFEELKLIWAFYRLYKSIKPDALLHYTIKPNIYGTLAARLAGVPVVSNISGLGTVFLDHSWSSRVARLLYRAALKFPVKVFFQNNEDRALFVQSKLVNGLKTAVLPGSGIDTVKFSPVDKPQAGLPFTFLFIARLVKDKGLAEFIDAARVLKAKYPEARFQILGSYYPGNPTAITPKDMVLWQRQGLVEYLGTNNDVKPFIAQADCVVLPSYREGLSRVLLEAASMARPIVTTNVPGCRDVVEHGMNGYLCVAKDADSLAEQMQLMLELDAGERKLMGERGRAKVVEEYDEALVIEQYRDVISGIFG